MCDRVSVQLPYSTMNRRVKHSFKQLLEMKRWVNVRPQLILQLLLHRSQSAHFFSYTLLTSWLNAKRVQMVNRV